MEYLQYVSIGLEVVIAVIFARIALGGRPYMWGLFVTYAIYVFYDLARELAWPVGHLTILAFFVATVCALYSATCLYRELSRR